MPTRTANSKKKRSNPRELAEREIENNVDVEGKVKGINAKQKVFALICLVITAAIGLIVTFYITKDVSENNQNDGDGNANDVLFNEDWNRHSTKDGCGKPKIKPELITKRIVGGLEAKRHTWPWQIAVMKYKNFGGGTISIKHLCGGTVISPKSVITATHCFLNKQRNDVTTDTSRYRILVGGHDKAQITDGAKLIEILQINHHPKNNLASFSKGPGVPVNDISVLQLNDVIDPSQSVPIVTFACLPQPYEVLISGKRCWTSGWGLTQGTGFETVLKQASQKIISQRSCNVFYKNLISDEVHVCTMENNMGTCQGDSGGPLVCQDDDDQWVLYGVVSFGPQHCSQYPSVFSPVTNYIPWICCFLEQLENYGPCLSINC